MWRNRSFQRRTSQNFQQWERRGLLSPQFSAAGTITNVKRWLKLVFIFSLSSCQTNFVDKKCFRVYRKLITYPVTIVVNNLFPRVLSLALRNKFVVAVLVDPKICEPKIREGRKSKYCSYDKSLLPRLSSADGAGILKCQQHPKDSIG